MFRKYVSDLIIITYLSSEVGIAISNEIIAHILWGDDPTQQNNVRRTLADNPDNVSR